jgi:hypothetical protein
MSALRPPSRATGGMLLFEVMLAVAIFAAGVLTLGRCVENLIRAEKFRREEALAERVLANYFVQIETEALPVADKMTEQLKGAWEGMTMNITREPLKLMNEKEQELFGLYQVNLDLTWKSGGDIISRSLSFRTYPRQR